MKVKKVTINYETAMTTANQVEKIIANLFLVHGFKHSDEYLTLTCTPAKITSIMTDVFKQLKLSGYSHFSEVEGVQYIAYPPNAKFPKVMVQLDAEETKGQINKFNMYFE